MHSRIVMLALSKSLDLRTPLLCFECWQKQWAMHMLRLLSRRKVADYLKVTMISCDLQCACSHGRHRYEIRAKPPAVNHSTLGRPDLLSLATVRLDRAIATGELLRHNST